MKQKQCHKCQFNGLGSDECLKCVGSKDLRLPNTFVHLGDGYQPTDAPRPHHVEESVSALPFEAEDRLRQFLCDFFDLPPVYILMLAHLMHNGSLASFDDYVHEIHNVTRKRITRQRAHQIKEALLVALKTTLAAPLVLDRAATRSR